MNSLDRLGLAVPPAVEITPVHARPTILVADDSADNRDMMRVLLELKGYEVIVAEDGKEAFELALARSPDLILLDLQLPLMDGLSVVRDLHSKGPHRRRFRTRPAQVSPGRSGSGLLRLSPKTNMF